VIIKIFKCEGFHPILSYESWIEYVDSKQTRVAMPWSEEEEEEEEEEDLAILLYTQVTRSLLHVYMRLDLGDKACIQCFNKELLVKWPLRRPTRRWEDNTKMNILDCEYGRWMELAQDNVRRQF
jgi:hypothetical protein